MRLRQQLLTKNDCYKAGRTIQVKGVMVHSTGANNPKVCRYVPGDAEMGLNTADNHWDRPDLTKCYFAQVYQEAAELTAMLCRQYGLDPLADGVVICHQEGFRRGVASNHADVLHWFPKMGKPMDDFRAEVARLMKGEDDVTYEQWKEFMEQYRQELGQQPAPDWGEKELERAKELGLTDGSRPQDLATRQEVASMIIRAKA